MSYRLKPLLACALFALTAVSPVLAADDDITVRVVTHGSTVVIDVELPLTVSPEEAWSTITDYDRMTEFIPNLKESRIVSRDGNRLVVEQKGRARRGAVSFAFENVRDVVLVPPREIRTRLVSGSMRAATSQTRLDRTDTG